MQNNTLQERFTFYFKDFFASIDKMFSLEERLGTRLYFYKFFR